MSREVAGALRVAVGLVVRKLRQTPVDGGELSLSESSALGRLERRGPATSSDLARSERISPQSMGVTVAALLDRGLHRAQPRPGGRPADRAVDHRGRACRRCTTAAAPAPSTSRRRCATGSPRTSWPSCGPSPRCSSGWRRSSDGGASTTLTTTAGRPKPPKPDSYAWVALANTTAAIFMASLDGSVVIIALPAIFKGINLDPLSAGNISYLLWMIMGYRLVQAVLVVNLGKLGDIFGRVKMYNAGFVVFTIASILLSFDPFSGTHGALWLIGWRLLQAFGGSMLMANSAAILTDAFPPERRGFALGTNQIAALAGMFIGLVAGGLLAAWDWRAVFWINLPVGVFGTLWAYLKLRDNGVRRPAKIDWWGNITFALGLGSLLVGITYGIQPHGSSSMGWTGPVVLGELIGGAVLLAVFLVIETRVAEPMFRLGLFKIRAFAFGNLAGLLVSIARGGIQFMLIIWLQGIWLPLHGYSYDQTPLWAGIFLLPMTAGFLVSGPDLGHPVRPVRLAGHLLGRHGHLRGVVRRAHPGPGELPLLGVRAAHRAERDRQRNVRLAQLVLHHGRGAGRGAGRRLRHALHLPELRAPRCPSAWCSR